MSQQLSSSSSNQRSERRIAVRLPLKVSGRDPLGNSFEEQTSSENLCRNGAAFLTRLDLPIGSDLDIRIPYSQSATRRPQPDFTTQGRVVHIGHHVAAAEKSSAATAGATNSTIAASANATADAGTVKTQPERLIGVQFTGPRFRRLFRSESLA
jgi:PilZ domain-containing protein